jgi:probable rRNA maturation factor
VIILKKKVEGASRDALLRFLARAKRSAGLRGEVNVLVAGNREIRDLNRRYRSKDQPTDVLSFPAEGAAGKDFAGDIAISADEASRSAHQFGHSSAEELKILMLHGVLHLAGYDHERDNGRMAQMEERLRAQLGLPGALIARRRNGARPRHLRRKGQSR